MKKEELYRRRYHSERELKECIKEYIAYYNEQRLNEGLNYKTPKAVEEAFIKSIL